MLRVGAHMSVVNGVAKAGGPREDAFRRRLHDQRFVGLPILIETEKSKTRATPGAVVVDPLDVQNLDALRRLRG